MIKVSDYIANFLIEKDIKDIFVVDGAAAASMIVSAANTGLNYYCPLHEQAGSFMVDGYYKASRKMTAMIATSGPGGQNLINGIAASWYDSIPAFYITGQINSKFIKPTNKIRQHGFQENDIVSMVDTVTKYAYMIRDANSIAYHLEKAYFLSTSGRPGPVLLDIPLDIQNTYVEEDTLSHFFAPVETCNVDNSKLDQCISMLKLAKRPLILIGGGVWLSNGVNECKDLINKLYIPFVETWNMLDFCNNDELLYGGRVGTYGGDGRNFAIQNCDLLLCIGSRLSGRVTGGRLDYFARDAKKIFVDIDQHELDYQQVKGDLNICMDAKTFCKSIDGIIGEYKSNIKWNIQVKEWKNKYSVMHDKKSIDGIVNPYIFVNELSNELGKDAVIVHEAGGNCVVTSQAYKAKYGQRIFTNNGNSSLGYSLPAAIGACIASDKKPVVCIVGDGGLNFNIQELQTIKYYKLPIKIFVFNNNCFGITKAYRDHNLNSVYAGVDADNGMSSPNFIKIAKAYGIKTEIIDNESELHKIKDVLNSDNAVLCNINMDKFNDYTPRISGWATPIEDMYPYLDRTEFKNNMIIKTVEGWEQLYK